MATTWTIAIDWNRDNDFLDTHEDVTQYVISARWFLGMRQPYQIIADDSMLNLVLDNQDKRFSPENSASPIVTAGGKLQPFRPIRIQSDDGTTVRTHWRGWIESIHPDVDENGKRQVRIQAAGAMQFLRSAETSLPLQENLRADEVIDQLMTNGMWPSDIFWTLDKSELDKNTRLADPSINMRSLEQGKSIFTMVGDNWIREGGYSHEKNDTYDIYRAIWDVTNAEQGRFFFDREGKAVFWNRHHLALIDTTSATFDNDMPNLEYTYADLRDIKNEVIVVCHPRVVSETTNEQLWELKDEVRVDAGKERKYVAWLQDADGNRVGAKGISATNVNFKHGSATVNLTPRANSVEVEIKNEGTDRAVLDNLKLEGQKVADRERMEAIVRDEDSIAEYGRRTLKINLPVIDQLDEAERIAQANLNKRSQPRGIVRRMDLHSHGLESGGHHANQLSLGMGDRIIIKENQTQHGQSGSGKPYHIIGEAHTLSQGATRFETSWYLEPGLEKLPWILGNTNRSKLGKLEELDPPIVPNQTYLIY